MRNQLLPNNSAQYKSLDDIDNQLKSTDMSKSSEIKSKVTLLSRSVFKSIFVLLSMNCK